MKLWDFMEARDTIIYHGRYPDGSPTGNRIISTIILRLLHSLNLVAVRLSMGEREIKFTGLFGDRGHRGPYSPYKPCNHNLYIGIIIFPHIDNPQSTGCNKPKKKKPIKIINEKSEGPINLTNHWRKRLWISLHMDLKRLD